MKVVFSARARRDLNEIATYIARENKPRAQSFVRELRRAAEDLAANPLAFSIVPNFAHLNIRRRVHRSYLIFYRIERDAVQIVCVVHGARNYESVLRREPSVD